MGMLLVFIAGAGNAHATSTGIFRQSLEKTSELDVFRRGPVDGGAKS
jgi:hypothetical protein